MNTFQYNKTQIRWEQNSSIRNRPHRIIDNLQLHENIYPISRQPLCIHPLVMRRGKDTIQFILNQSLYKFLNDIAIIETALVNRVANKLYYDKYSFSILKDVKHDILTIIIDETYHAYVAIDFINQVVDITKIHPLVLPKETQLGKAIELVKNKLDEKIQDIFEIVAICIAENSITNELISISRGEDLNIHFNQILKDHAIDEGRHSGIFAFILKDLWMQITENEKNKILDVLPFFISNYLSNDIQNNFEIEILRNCGFNEDEIIMITGDIHFTRNLDDILETSPVAKGICEFLSRCDVRMNIAA